MSGKIFRNFDIDISSELADRYKTSWVEDSFDFDSKFGKQVAVPKSNEHIDSSFSQKRGLVFAFSLFIFFLIFISRMFYLQIIEGDENRRLAEGNRQRIIPIPAERGLIYDRNDIQLTKNIPSLSLALTPQDLPKREEEREKVVQSLASIIHKDVEEVRNILKEYGAYSYESIILEEDIDYETALAIQVAASDLPGINIIRGSKRLYTMNLSKEEEIITSLSHIVGYGGKISREELDRLYEDGYLPSDNIGKTGVEKVYEEMLRGVYGRKRVERNAMGRDQDVLAEEAPEPGDHLRLTIDANMQAELENIIKDHLDKLGKDRASGIVMNPNSGEILALVSWPAFDNNDFTGGISHADYNKYIENKNNPLFNRAIGGAYPSGSVVKMAIAAAALEEGIIKANTTFLSNGGLRVSRWFFPDWKAGGHGITDVRKSIAWSVNTFYYYIGGGYGDFVGIGIDKINEYLKKFGFAEKTQIDLPAESIGFIPTREWKEEVKNERWYVGDTYNMSIGQGDFLTSPLQITNMTATIANRGEILKPHVVESIIDPVTKEERKIHREVIKNNPVSKKHLDTVALGMRDCVTYGACSRLSLLPFSSAGKTGTAQWSSIKDTHAWFTSFAPYENPEIVVTIMVEEGGGGGEVAAPIAYDFYRWWWGYKNK
jgi:penicillin-binding protein 2